MAKMFGLWKLNRVTNLISDWFNRVTIHTTTGDITTIGFITSGAHEINISTERGSAGEEYDLLLYASDSSADHVQALVFGASNTTQDTMAIFGGEDASGQWGKGFMLYHDKTTPAMKWLYSTSGKNDGTETLLWTLESDGDITFAKDLSVTGDIGCVDLTASGIVSADGYIEAVATKTADYTATSSDSLIIADGTSNTVTITLPTAVGITGRIYKIKCIDDTYQVDVEADGTETIDGSLTKTLSQWDCLTVISDGSDWMVI